MQLLTILRSRTAASIRTLFLSAVALAVPQAAQAACTPVTSTASPVTNTLVTCTGTTLNQNMPFGLGVGYGTFSENGDTIVVQMGASVTGDAQGLGLQDGNTVNNSGAVTGANAGIATFGGMTITVNNLTAGSTITATSGSALSVDNVILSNAGTITGGSDGIFATGAVTLASNTGSIAATATLSAGISADSVSGSNAGLISGAIAISTSNVNLTSNSGTIQATSPFAIFSGSNVVIGSNSGSIVGEINAVGTINITNTSTGSLTTTDPVFADAILTNSDITVANSGSIFGKRIAIHGANVNVTNNFGGTIAGDSVAVEGFNTTTLVNDGTVAGNTNNGDAVLADSANITNNATGIIEAAGNSSDVIGANSLLLNNAGTVRETGNLSVAVDTEFLEAGSTNSGTIIADGIGINANEDLKLTNSGTIMATGASGFVTNGIEAATSEIVNTSSGVISGETRGIIANDLNLTNSGTVTATGVFGFQVAAILVDTADIFNTSSGIISATGTAANNDAINVQGNAAIVDNFGMISSTGRSAIRVGSNAGIINESGGTIIGVTGIVFRDATGMNVPVVNSDVFNAGTITGTGGTAINFAFTPGSGPLTLTLGPGSVINGIVLGTGGDILQLGGKSSDTFDVDNIGATQQYQGFTTFNKVGSSIWTLTGTGTQNWSVISGTLIGDTNSLGAATYPVSAGATLEFKQDFDGSYSGAVTGDGSFAKDGLGTLILTGENTYTGGTTISGGTLQLGNGGASGSVTGDVVANGRLAFDRSDTVTFAGIISGIGTVNQIGTGTTILTGLNTYGSGTFILAGTLALAGAGSIANSSDVSDNGTFDVSAASGGVSIVSLEGSGQVLLGANTLTLTAPTGFFGGVISGTGGLTLLGSSQETLTGTYSYSGATMIAAPNMLAPPNKAPVIGTLVLAGGNNTLTGDIVDDGVLVGQATSVTLSGNISGTGSLSIKGGATTLSGNNSYFGGTTVAGATLAISADNNLGTGDLTLLDGSTLQLTASFVLAHAISVSGDPTFDVQGSNTVNISTPITDGAQLGDVVKTGTGTLLLTATNTYTGGTVVNGGTLQLGNTANASSVVGPITVSNLSLLNVANSDFSGVTTLAIGDALALFQGATSAATTQISVTGGGSITFFNTATAANAQILIDHGVAAFRNLSSGGSAQFRLTNIGSTTFADSATAANATFNVGGMGTLVFFDGSSGGNAKINATQNAMIEFEQMSTAGNAMLSLSQQATLTFARQPLTTHGSRLPRVPVSPSPIRPAATWPP